MKNSKIIDILKGITPTEVEELAVFLNFYCYRTKFDVAVDDIKKLFGLLQTLHPNYSADNVNAEVIFQKIYPNKPFSKPKLAKLQSSLLKGIEQYIVFLKVSDTEILKDKTIASFFSERRLDERYELQIDALRKNVHNTIFEEHDAVLEKYLIERVDFMKKSSENLRKDDININASIKNLDYFYLLARLEWILIAITQNKTVKIDMNNVLLAFEEIDSLAMKLNLYENSLLYIYKLAINLMLYEKGFEEFHAILRGSKLNLSFDQKQMFHTLERNYLTLQYNQGQNDALFLLFSLMKEHFDMGLLFYNNGLLTSTIQNLVTIALKCKAYDWAEGFITNHGQKLIGTTEKEAILDLLNVQIEFSKRNYKVAFKKLPNYKFKDPHYEMALRRLEIKILYEMQDDGLDFRLEAFKNYLYEGAKKKLPNLIFQSNNNFVNLVKRLTNSDLKDSSKLQKLKQQIAQKATYAEREWLIDKIEAIKY